MKSFKFRYSTTVWILLALVVILSVSGLAWNVFNVFAYKGTDTFKIISYVIIAILTLCLFIFSVSAVLYGRYVIKKDCVTVYFGLFKTKIALNEITEVVHFKKSNKLVAYFTNDSYSVIIISPEDYSNFVLALREVNPKIVYDTQIDGEDTPE